MSKLDDVPHDLKAQLALLETLIRKKRQESLAQDQADVDLALGSDNAWAGHRERLVLPIEGDQ